MSNRVGVLRNDGSSLVFVSLKGDPVLPTPTPLVDGRLLLLVCVLECTSKAIFIPPHLRLTNGLIILQKRLDFAPPPSMGAL